MSQETQEWLIKNLRIGFTTEDGPAWWASEDHLADGSHFPGPVPEDEVRRLLDVRLIAATSIAQYTDDDGHRQTIIDPDRQQIVRADTEQILGVFKRGYQIHPYNKWINDSLESIADSKLATKSVGLLRKGGVAFHQVRLPETYEVAGFKYQPFFTGGTSADGTVGSTWFTGADAAVCDNTFEWARANAATRVVLKHTRNSPTKLGEVRDKLGLILQAGEEFAAQIEELLKVDVSDADFALWLDEIAALPEKQQTKGGGPGRGYTLAETKRDELTRLWNKDPKVTPWKGTGFGILQLDNTYRTYNGIVKGVDGGIIERNLVNQINGKSAAADDAALAALAKVQERKLVVV